MRFSLPEEEQVVQFNGRGWISALPVIPEHDVE
jgi:hypothetical protein